MHEELYRPLPSFYRALNAQHLFIGEQTVGKLITTIKFQDPAGQQGSTMALTVAQHRAHTHTHDR